MLLKVMQWIPASQLLKYKQVHHKYTAIYVILERLNNLQEVAELIILQEFRIVEPNREVVILRGVEVRLMHLQV